MRGPKILISSTLAASLLAVVALGCARSTTNLPTWKGASPSDTSGPNPNCNTLADALIAAFEHSYTSFRVSNVTAHRNNEQIAKVVRYHFAKILRSNEMQFHLNELGFANEDFSHPVFIGLLHTSDRVPADLHVRDGDWRVVPEKELFAQPYPLKNVQLQEHLKQLEPGVAANLATLPDDAYFMRRFHMQLSRHVAFRFHLDPLTGKIVYWNLLYQSEELVADDLSAYFAVCTQTSSTVAYTDDHPYLYALDTDAWRKSGLLRIEKGPIQDFSPLALAPRTSHVQISAGGELTPKSVRALSELPMLTHIGVSDNDVLFAEDKHPTEGAFFSLQDMYQIATGPAPLELFVTLIQNPQLAESALSAYAQQLPQFENKALQFPTLRYGSRVSLALTVCSATTHARTAKHLNNLGLKVELDKAKRRHCNRDNAPRHAGRY